MNDNLSLSLHCKLGAPRCVVETLHDGRVLILAVRSNPRFRLRQHPDKGDDVVREVTSGRVAARTMGAAIRRGAMVV